jgi:hypothetical protein
MIALPGDNNYHFPYNMLQKKSNDNLQKFNQQLINNQIIFAM